LELRLLEGGALSDERSGTTKVLDVGCPWCGDVVRARHPASGFTVARCQSCGTGVTWPPPTDAELDRAYGDWYRPDAGRFQGHGDRLLRWSRSTLARSLDRRAPEGAVLDVGAGDGSLVRAFRARGREAVGLERVATPYAQAGEIEHVEGEWSAVVFWHSLEHFRNPTSGLEAAAAKLKPGGLLVVAVPNFDSVQARIFGRRWFALDLPRHLVHLRGPELVRRMHELGLRVERVSSVRGGQVFFGWLDGLVRSLPGQFDLYDAIRRPEARTAPLSGAQVLATLAAAAFVSPLALLGSLLEVLLGRGGSVYVLARRVGSEEDLAPTAAVGHQAGRRLN
jgi:SAM-dependent methyltransferase